MPLKRNFWIVLKNRLRGAQLKNAKTLLESIKKSVFDPDRLLELAGQCVTATGTKFDAQALCCAGSRHRIVIGSAGV